eukprot:11208826-Lingulodinium_polyedra.AAC.1
MSPPKALRPFQCRMRISGCRPRVRSVPYAPRYSAKGRSLPSRCVTIPSMAHAWLIGFSLANGAARFVRRAGGRCPSGE